jgi:hypothetical protein
MEERISEREGERERLRELREKGAINVAPILLL